MSAIFLLGRFLHASYENNVDVPVQQDTGLNGQSDLFSIRYPILGISSSDNVRNLIQDLRILTKAKSGNPDRETFSLLAVGNVRNSLYEKNLILGFGGIGPSGIYLEDPTPFSIKIYNVRLSKNSGGNLP